MPRSGPSDTALPRIGLLTALAWLATWAVNRSLVRVAGDSMLPALRDGDVVLTLPTMRGLPPVGSVVVVDPPGGAPTSVKRLVAADGQHVAVREGVVRVDDVAHPDGRVTGGTGGWNVSRGHAFVLGDHRAASTDSRAWGPLPAARVRRRVVAVVHPVARRVGAGSVRAVGLVGDGGVPGADPG